MANSIEWAHASQSAALVDAEDISSDYEGLGEGEIGVWLGSDAAVILYGTPEQVIKVAERIRELAYSVHPGMTTPKRCPRCDSPDPKRHPAMQFEGEVQPCPDPWHGDAGLEADLAFIRKTNDDDDQWPAPGVAGVGP